MLLPGFNVLGSSVPSSKNCLFKHKEKTKYIQLQSNETTIWPVYQAKWVHFKIAWCYVKLLPCPCALEFSKSQLRPFKCATQFDFVPQGASALTKVKFKIFLKIHFMKRIV